MNNTLVFNGSSSNMVKLLKRLFTTPVLGAPDVKLNSLGGIDQFASLFTTWAGVPIYTEKYEETGKAELGKQMLIRASGGIEQVTDNFAPLPRKWVLDGYLQGVSLSFIPGVGGLASSIATAALLQLQKNYIRFLRLSRVSCVFRTAEGESTYVYIEDYSFIKDPTMEHADKIHLILSEMNALNINTAGTQSTSIPETGSWFGSASSIGSVSAIPLIGAAAMTVDSLIALIPGVVS